jgi:hypothetical protein
VLLVDLRDAGTRPRFKFTVARLASTAEYRPTHPRLYETLSPNGALIPNPTLSWPDTGIVKNRLGTAKSHCRSFDCR